MYGDKLSEGMADLLARALVADRLRTVLKLISAVAEHNLERDTKVRGRHRYQSAPPGQVGEVFQDGLASAKLIGKLGNAISTNRMNDEEVVDLVRDIIRIDGLSSERLESACGAILGD